MKKRFQFPARSEFDLILFFLGLLLFNWPLLTVGMSRTVDGMLCYMFLTWIGIIIMLFATARAILRGTPMKKDG